MLNEIPGTHAAPLESMPAFLKRDLPEAPARAPQEDAASPDPLSAGVLEALPTSSALRVNARCAGARCLSGCYQLTSAAGIALLGSAALSTIILAFAPASWAELRTIALGGCMFSLGVLASNKLRIWEEVNPSGKGASPYV